MPAFSRKSSFSFLPVTLLLAIFLPMALALLIAHWASMQHLQDISTLTARQILTKADRVSGDMVRSMQLTHIDPGQDPCSPDNLLQMRKAMLYSGTLVDIGYIRSGQLLCSAFGQRNLPIGKPTYTSTTGYHIRNNFHPQAAPDITLLVSADPATGIALFTNPAQVMDGIPDSEPWSAAVVGLGPDGAVLASRGEFNPGWKQHASHGYSGVFMQDDNLIAWERSRRGAYIAFAAMPREMWQPTLRKSALLALALSLPIGLLLAFILRRMATRDTTMRYLLKQAIKRGELSLVYQPVVDLASGRWVGAEALMRWNRRRGETISPDIFIPLAEKSGLMPALGEHLIHAIERETPALFAHHPAFHVALNFSAENFCADGLPARLKAATERIGTQPRNLHLEVTERVFMHQESATLAISELRRLGFGVSIDDFGTGFSSLSYLTRLQFDSLKIDKTFVSTVETGAITSKIVDHIIEMSKSLGITMIAEGVETPAQADYLREHGVQYAQGWLYAKGMPIRELLAQLARHSQQD